MSIKLTKQGFYILAPIISGILLFLSFPTFDLGFLAWLSFVPLLYFIATKRPLFSFFQGFIAGVIFYAVSFPWIAQTMNTYGHLSIAASYLIFLLLVVYLALYIAFLALIFSLLLRRFTEKALLIIPFVWVALEYIRNYFVSGFPWILLGYSQHKYLPIIQISDIFGVYGVSFIIVLVNSLLVCWLKLGFKKKLSLAFSSVAIVIIGLNLVYGFFRLNESPEKPESINIALIQGNVPQDEKLDYQFIEKIFQDHFIMTLNASKEREILVIWSESAVPLMYNYSEAYREALKELVSGKRVYLLFGTIDKRIEKGSDEELYFNSAFFLNPSGELAGQYDKIHLVPFSEYAPLKKWLLFLDKLIEQHADFIPGRHYTLFKYKESPFCSPICYEIIFPELIRRFVREGAQFIVTITNDAWFGRSSAPYQHFNMAIFRAVENRRWLARSANTGISGVIDPYGKVIAKSDIFVQTFINSKIYPNKQLTLYTKYGDVLPWISLVLTFAALLTLWLRRKQEKKKSK